MKLIILISIISILFTSCSVIEYKIGDRIPVYLGHQKYHKDKFTFDHNVDFFLFGLIPSLQTIDIDKLGQQKSLTEMSNVNIYERTDLKDILYALFTLGMYTPKTITVMSSGKK